MRFRITALAALVALLPATTWALPDEAPFASVDTLRPAAIESSWTRMKMPDGGRTAFASISYLMALDDDWGFGPGVYGAAKGNYGGIFTVGFTGQRRWRLNSNTHLAASLYVGAGGGLSTQQLRFGGGLMLRPELSLRTEVGAWYTGVGLSQIRFPSGNVKSGVGLSFTLGRAMSFASFSPDDAGRRGRASQRTGLQFDEVSLMGGYESPRSVSIDRNGERRTRRVGKAGAELRQYIVDGSWWGIEAAGGAQGGADGYMEVLGQIGQDWALGSPRLRVGGQVGVGLAGGGNLDTGSGLLLRAGPTLRWITPWGPSLRLDAGLTHAPQGNYSARFVRAAISMPLDQTPVLYADDSGGTVRVQQLGASVMHLPRVRFKDGRREAVSHLAINMSREFTLSLYGTAQAGSAAAGHAGAYSFGLIGLGVQSAPLWSGMRVGAEWLVGAAGGGGVQVGGGAVTQAELWAQWRVGERLRLRTGLGEFRTMRGHNQSTPVIHVGLNYAFGTLQR
ncbi:hypothetical protein J2X20_002131 [Pelomonas saccharophila]|uniref:Outer membrane protein beta-barrel domain-containing protein n=1 Tax=Roseateles saccharophilus TaxID=304 RepID=A0ABU1YKX2_ROSSA|nr:hypothetical protein [Roseateles saccharophilus]MDR7269502.1 hypothetical protein [Roseateles saccharophilus]